MILDSITYSEYFVGDNSESNVRKVCVIPDTTTLEDKSLQELRDLAITQVDWNYCTKLGFTLNDGQKIET